MQIAGHRTRRIEGKIVHRRYQTFDSFFSPDRPRKRNRCRSGRVGEIVFIRIFQSRRSVLSPSFHKASRKCDGDEDSGALGNLGGREKERKAKRNSRMSSSFPKSRLCYPNFVFLFSSTLGSNLLFDFPSAFPISPNVPWQRWNNFTELPYFVPEALKGNPSSPRSSNDEAIADVNANVTPGVPFILYSIFTELHLTA